MTSSKRPRPPRACAAGSSLPVDVFKKSAPLATATAAAALIVVCLVQHAGLEDDLQPCGACAGVTRWR